MKKNLILFFFAAIFSLLLLEAGLRVFGISHPRSIWLQVHERGFLMNQSGGSALHTFSEGRQRYRFTEMRTRGNQESIRDDRTNIFVFGDSFTFGLYLSDDETFVSHLNRYFSGAGKDYYNFVNAGVGGSGIADWISWIETFGDDVPIDGILFVQNYDDYERMISRNLFVLDDDGKLRESYRWRQRGIKNMMDRSRFYRFLQENSAIITGINSLVYRNYLIEDVTGGFDPERSKTQIPNSEQFRIDNDYVIHLAESLLEYTRDYARQHEIPFLITTTGFIDFGETGRMSGWNRRVFTRLDSLTAALEIPYHDITPDFKNRINGDYNSILLRPDGHPNGEGASITGELIAPWVFTRLTEE